VVPASWATERLIALNSDTSASGIPTQLSVAKGKR